MRFRPVIVMLVLASTLTAGCAIPDYRVIHPPNYDHLIGATFSEKVYMGRREWLLVHEVDGIEEFQQRGRSDGCQLIFGVRKSDDVIMYWRVDSPPGTCLVRKNPLNV